MSLTDLVIEWRDARQALFDASSTADAVAAKPFWERLARAEHALMDRARTLGAPVGQPPEGGK